MPHHESGPRDRDTKSDFSSERPTPLKLVPGRNPNTRSKSSSLIELPTAAWPCSRPSNPKTGRAALRL